MGEREREMGAGGRKREGCGRERGAGGIERGVQVG